VWSTGHCFGDIVIDEFENTEIPFGLTDREEMLHLLSALPVSREPLPQRVAEAERLCQLVLHPEPYWTGRVAELADKVVQVRRALAMAKESQRRNDPPEPHRGRIGSLERHQIRRILELHNRPLPPHLLDSN
jgi:hypothetical protein